MDIQHKHAWHLWNIFLATNFLYLGKNKREKNSNKYLKNARQPSEAIFSSKDLLNATWHTYSHGYCLYTYYRCVNICENQSLYTKDKQSWATLKIRLELYLFNYCRHDETWCTLEKNDKNSRKKIKSIHRKIREQNNTLLKFIR